MSRNLTIVCLILVVTVIAFQLRPKRVVRDNGVSATPPPVMNLPVKQVPLVADTSVAIRDAKAANSTRNDVAKGNESQDVYKPSDAQSASLDSAKNQEALWEKRRLQFLEGDQKLERDALAKISELRNKLLSQEQTLLDSPPGSTESESNLRDQLRDNRVAYYKAIEEIIGREKWDMLLSYYVDFWAISKNHQVALHLPVI